MLSEQLPSQTGDWIATIFVTNPLGPTFRVYVVVNGQCNCVASLWRSSQLEAILNLLRAIIMGTAWSQNTILDIAGEDYRVDIDGNSTTFFNFRTQKLINTGELLLSTLITSIHVKSRVQVFVFVNDLC